MKTPACPHDRRRACTTCRAVALAAGWTVGPGLGDEAADVVEALVERPTDVATSLHRFGETAGRAGWPAATVTDWVDALARQAEVARVDPKPLQAFTAGVELGRGWAEGSTRGGGSLRPAVDPTTGLADAEVLIQALDTFHDRCRASGVDACGAATIVVVDADLHDDEVPAAHDGRPIPPGVRSAAALVRAGHLALLGSVTKAAVPHGELVCALAPGRVAVLSTRPDDGTIALRVEAFLRRAPGLANLAAVVWTEPIPAHAHVRRFVEDLVS